MSDSSPATPNSGRATPPFADGPSTFLENLTSKIQGGSVTANAVAELHRVRAELSGQVQATSNRHEMHLKQISARIAAFQQEFKPKIQNVERQLGFTQKQLDELRQRVQKLATEEVSGLQHQFDQMGARFDRFMRTDVESKLKPMHDAIRHARTRLDELENTATSGFKKMNDNTTALATRMRETRSNAEDQEEALDEQLDDLVPRIEALERALGEVGDTSVVGKAPAKRTVSTPAQMGLRLKAAQDNFSEFKGDVMPAMIQESAATFVDAAQQVGQFCDFKIGELQSAMETVECENRMVEQQRRQEEETLDKLMKAGLEVQNRLEVLGQDTIAKVTALEQSLESTANGLLAQISDVSVGTTNEGDEAQKHVEEEVSELKVSIDGLIAKLRRLVKKCGQENLDSQKQVLTRISGIRNQLVGEENALGRTESTEERIEWVIDEIQRIDAERIRAQERNGGPQSLANRLANIDERLAECNERLDALESYPKDNQRRKVSERKVVQPEENPYEVSHRGFDPVTHEEEEEEKLPPAQDYMFDQQPVDLREEQKLEPVEPAFAPEEEETDIYAVPRKGRKGAKKENKLEPVEVQEREEVAPVVEAPRRKRKSPKEEPKLPPIEQEFAQEEEEMHQETFDSQVKDEEEVTYPVDDPVSPALKAISDAPRRKQKGKRQEEEWPQAEASVEAEQEVIVPEEGPRKKRKGTKEEIKPVQPEENASPEPEPVVEPPPRRKRKTTKEEIKPPQVEENTIPEPAPVADAPARKRTRGIKKQEEPQPPVQDIQAEEPAAPVEEAPRKKRRNVKEEPEVNIATEAEAQPANPSRKPKAAKKEEPKPLPIEETPAPVQEEVKAASEAPPRRKKGTKKEEPKPLPIEESPVPEQEDVKAASEAPPRRKKSTKKEEEKQSEAEPNVLPAAEEPVQAASDAPRKRRHKRHEAPPPASTDKDDQNAAPANEEKPASDPKINRKEVTPEEEQIQLPTQNLMDRLVQTSPPQKKSRSHEDDNKMIPMKSLHDSLLGMQGEEPEKSDQRHRRHRSHKKKNE